MEGASVGDIVVVGDGDIEGAADGSGSVAVTVAIVGEGVTVVVDDGIGAHIGIFVGADEDAAVTCTFKCACSLTVKKKRAKSTFIAY